MSWKLFFQILLLVVVSALIVGMIKMSFLRCKYKGGYFKDHPHHEKLHKSK
jgi:uncharacterized protein YneF (UPF0154 family)